VPKEGLEKFLKELNKELKALKPGECLVYGTKKGTESSLGLVLSLSHVKNLEVMTRLGRVYAYKEK